MATLLNGPNLKMVWSDGFAERTALYAVRKVTTADVCDIGGDFSVIKQTAWLGTTTTGVATGSFSGTVVTAPSGLSADGGYLLVYGVAAAI